MAGRELIEVHFGTGALANDVVSFEPVPPALGRPLASRVVIAGRTVVEHGRLVCADMAEIEAEARQSAAALWPRMATR